MDNAYNSPPIQRDKFWSFHRSKSDFEECIIGGEVMGAEHTDA